MKWKSYLMVIAAWALVITGCGTQPSATAGKVSSEHAAPKFSLQTINDNGKSISLSSLINNKEPILLNAFASWCEDCNMEEPDLVRVAEKYSGKIKMIGVDMTVEDTTKGVTSFIQKFKIPYPVLIDKDGSFMESYKVSGLPTTFLLSPQGNIISTHLGPMTSKQMQAMIAQVLQG